MGFGLENSNLINISALITKFPLAQTPRLNAVRSIQQRYDVQRLGDRQEG